MKLRRSEREALGTGAFFFGLLAVVFAFVATMVSVQAKSRADDAKRDAAAGGAGAAQVSETEFRLDPGAVTGSKDGSIAVKNAGKVAHNLAVEGTTLKTSDIQPGGSESLSLAGLEDGTYTIYCAIPGHRESGMQGTLTVGTGGGTTNAATAHEIGHEGGTPDQLRKSNEADDKRMKDPVVKYVDQLTKGPNTKGVGNQLLPPKVLSDGTKEFDLQAKIIDWEVSPGQKVPAWAYGPMDGEPTVPGPVIKANPGDRVKIVLKNNLPQSTELHFHGLLTPNDVDGVPFVTPTQQTLDKDGTPLPPGPDGKQTTDPVKPGETRVYTWKLQDIPAVGMYHSHHHAEHQVPDGLAGAFIIGDQPVPRGIPVAKQEQMVLNDAGAIGLALNGKAFPGTLPVMAKQGDWVEINYFNEGLLIHPMHLHGMPQLVIAKDGNALPQPYEADVVTVAPGDRWTVLVHATTPGVWAYHCHILNHAEDNTGMMGMVTTFIVQ